MEKKPEIDGSYAEIEATELISKSAEIDTSSILVVVNSRLELAGEDKEKFVTKFSKLSEELKDETEGMNDEQKSFYILRHMLIS